MSVNLRGALVWQARHQLPLQLLRPVSISGLSSQGQALSLALSAPASPSPSRPSDPFVFLSPTHLPLLRCLPLYTLLSLFSSSLLPLWFPSLSSLPFLPDSLFPLFLLSLVPSSLSCARALSLPLSLSFPPFTTPHPSPNRSPLCPEALRVAAGIYSSPPPNTHPAWQV